MNAPDSEKESMGRRGKSDLYELLLLPREKRTETAGKVAG